MFGIGKTKAVRKFTEESMTSQLNDVMESADATHESHESIQRAGSQLLVILYGGGQNDTLNSMR